MAQPSCQCTGNKLLVIDAEGSENGLLQGSGLGEEGEGGVRLAREGDFVEGEGCEVAKQGWEGVDGFPVGDSAGVAHLGSRLTR